MVKPADVGRLESIGVRSQPRGEIVEADEALAKAGRGITGDYYARRAGGRREVTLMQFEHLAVIAERLGTWRVEPRETRRNLAISGIDVLALKDRTFSIGDVVLEGTGPCEPCRKMEASLGPGGARAMRGLGGITARIISGGVLRVGDVVALGLRASGEGAPRDRAVAASNRL
jgi:MOSC domain-containing protein YiiM